MNKTSQSDLSNHKCDMKFYRVVAPHYVAGLYVNNDGYVRYPAPILRWSKGKPWSKVSEYFRRKNFDVERLS